jgi:hypothetical protein
VRFAVSGGHVEHLLPGGDRARVDERLRGRQDHLGDLGVVPEAPGGANLVLVLSEVGHGTPKT